MGQQAEVHVDGVPLSFLAAWGDLEIRDRWPYGCWEASWSMPLDPWRRFPQVKNDKPVEVRIASHPLFAGNFADIDWPTGRMAAVGTCRQAEGTICFDGTGLTTSIPDVALDAAIAGGAVDGTRPASFSPVAFGEDDQTDSLNYLAPLLDAFSISVNKRWYVDTRRRWLLAPDPTTPTAMVINDSGVLGTSEEKKAGTVYARYINPSGTLATAQYPPGPRQRPEVGVDWTSLGPKTAAEAEALCEGRWSLLQGKAGWTNAIQVRTGQLLTMGGLPMPLWAFKAGQMVRLLGVRDERGLAANTDVVIGESVWRPGDDSLTLTPIGAAARDTRSIIAETGGVLL